MSALRRHGCNVHRDEVDDCRATAKEIQLSRVGPVEMPIGRPGRRQGPLTMTASGGGSGRQRLSVLTSVKVVCSASGAPPPQPTPTAPDRSKYRKRRSNVELKVPPSIVPTWSSPGMSVGEVAGSRLKKAGYCRPPVCQQRLCFPFGAL